MSRQQFRLLVVTSQILLFAMYPLGAVTDSLLAPELAGQLGIDPSVMEGEAGAGPFPDDPLYLLSLAVNFVTLVAAAGLFYGKRWGRTLFLVCFAASLVVIALTPVHVSAGLTAALGAIYGTLEGMILGLAYFSHLRRMFGRRVEGDEEEAE